MNLLHKYRDHAWLLLLVPIYVLFFVKLGAPQIRLWDEGWFTVHAVEMLQHGSLLVSYFDGEPSLTSSKPPLQTWLQMLSIRALGVNELAVRLPSAVASAVTVLLLFFATRKELGQPVAMMAALVLLTSIGFVGYHAARGAEADALLTLCLTAQAVAFFRFTQTRHAKWLWLLVGALCVGFLAKSVATLLFVPGFVVFTLMFDRMLMAYLLRSWQFYLGIVVVVAMAAGYVAMRESLQAGYVDMFFSSNVGRYTSSVGHDHRWDYYLGNMISTRYLWWMPIAVLGVVMSFATAENRFANFASVCVVVFLLVISFSRSKLDWYDMPVYPLAAVSVAFAIDRLLSAQAVVRKPLLVLLLFLFPTVRAFQHTQALSLNVQELDFESQERYLSDAFRQGKNVDGLVVAHDHFEGALLFYKHKFAAAGQTISLQNHVNGLGEGTKILVHSEAHKAELHEKYECTEIDRNRTAVVFNITGIKL